MKQTEELFKNGHVTSGGGRGRAFAQGTAFVEGVAFDRGSGGFWNSNAGGSSVGGVVNNNYTTNNYYGSSSQSQSSSSAKSSSSSSNKSSSSSAADEVEEEEEEKFEETIDWVETAIDRIERAIKRLERTADSTYKTWGERNEALAGQISRVKDEIDLQQKAYDKYMSKANSVGLSESYASKVRDGSIDIETITDESLNEQITEYKEWYEKALDAKDAIDELNESVSELYEQRFENVAKEFEGYLSVIEHEKNMLDEFINQSEAQGWVVSTKYYEALQKNERENIEELKKQRDAMTAEMNNAVNSGYIDKYSESW